MSKLPDNRDVTSDMIPNYCYYRAGTNIRGDAFVIDRHPVLVAQGMHQWSTTCSKKVTTKDKFFILKGKLAELEEE